MRGNGAKLANMRAAKERERQNQEPSNPVAEQEGFVGCLTLWMIRGGRLQFETCHIYQAKRIDQYRVLHRGQWWPQRMGINRISRKVAGLFPPTKSQKRS